MNEPDDVILGRMSKLLDVQITDLVANLKGAQEKLRKHSMQSSRHQNLADRISDKELEREEITSMLDVARQKVVKLHQPAWSRASTKKVSTLQT